MSSLPQYVPGQPYDKTCGSTSRFLTNCPPLNQYERQLSAEEFEYFHQFLEDPNLSKAVKSGVALILRRDLDRVYNNQYSQFPSLSVPLVDKYYKYYVEIEKNKEDSSVADEFAQASNEVINFNHWLRLPRGNTDLESQEQVERFIRSRQSYSNQVLESAKLFEKEREIEEMLLGEKSEAEIKKVREKEKEQAIVLIRSLENHMIKNVKEYLAALFNENPGRLFVNVELSRAEFEIREDLIKKVKKKEMKPEIAFAKYGEIIESFQTMPSYSQVLAHYKRITLQTKHPFALISRGTK